MNWGPRALFAVPTSDSDTRSLAEGFRYWGLGLRGLGFRFWGLGLRGLGFRYWGLGFGVQGFDIGVWGLGFRVSQKRGTPR